MLDITQEQTNCSTLPPDSEPINNTRLRRFLVLLAIKLLKRFRQRNGTVLVLSSNICVKYGPLRYLSEARTMQFLTQNTSIPVPKVLCSFTHKDWTYIVMERIHGEMIGHGWVARSAKSKAKILLQVKDMVQEMRKIPPQGMDVANVDGGPLNDCRLPGPSLRYGPFKCIQDFHKHLRQGLEFNPKFEPELRQLITQHDGPWPPPVFTHGDLSSLNILARGDKVVGIVDWETAGWFPPYWEYTTACQVNPQNSFWRDEIDKFLDPMPKELAMEKIRQQYFGDL